ncbi:hypothetical protein [Rhizobium rhizogenes]|uniref:hypothetical protein n=1 Tax=Rhizobium rhizogenes TaxID=359 RepID=UPI0015732D73|nr:hypothetical protein [Rhizobium rhizogenes]NTF67912.1 hypothetical protein [Rhizobium rhizogenes]
MVDIVNRLREVAEIETGLLYSRRTMLKDAADEITRLRSERDAAKAMCDEMAKALVEISDACPSGSRWTTMSDGTWRSACRDLQGIARLAVASYRKAQEVGNV